MEELFEEILLELKRQNKVLTDMNNRINDYLNRWKQSNSKISKDSFYKSDPVLTSSSIESDVNENCYNDWLNTEINQRDTKKRQLICIGVKESSSSSVEERITYDKNLLTEILQAIGCGDKINHVKFTCRLGSRDINRDRLLRVAFHDETTRDNVLRFSNKLRDSNHRNVWLHNDLTKMQLKALKEQKYLVKKKLSK